MKKLSIENRELLLKDLSARLLYGVKVNHKGLIRPLFSVAPTQWYQITLDRATDGNHNGLELVNLNIGEELKPYLRPMSSMTEEEKKKYESLCILIPINYDSDLSKYDYYTTDSIDSFDWLNTHHFDYRGLIEKGLALEAPDGMYDNEQNK